jgi:hypothetical protein
MSVYHSDLDDGRYLKQSYLKQAKKEIIKEMKN